MANFFAHNAGITDTNCPHRRYAENLDLADDGSEMYLRKWVEGIFNSRNMSAEGIEIDDILQWNSDDGTVTVFLDGEIHLFIPEDMCEDEAISNHLKRLGLDNPESENFEPMGFEPMGFSAASAFGGLNDFSIEPFSAFGGVVPANSGFWWNDDMLIGPALPNMHFIRRINNRTVVSNDKDTPRSSSLVLDIDNRFGRRDDVLNLLRMLTRDELKIVSRGAPWNRIHSVQYTEVDGDNLNYGTELIRRVIDSPHTITVNSDNMEHNMYFPDDERAAQTRDEGSSGRININTSQRYRLAYTLVADLIDIRNTSYFYWTGSETRVERIPNHMSLGHELIHALRASEGRYRPEELEATNVIRLLNGEVGVFEIALEEFATIGIPYQLNTGDAILVFSDSDWVITENALRKENELPIRVTHLGRDTESDALSYFSAPRA